MVKYTMELEWKKEILSGAGTEESPYVYGDEFPVCMETMEAWFRANAGADYCGNSSDATLKLHFLEEPSQEIKDAIQAKWDSLTPESAEASAYTPQAERIAAKAAAKTAAIAALATASGLSQQQISALLS
jgi:hypothetical protein